MEKIQIISTWLIGATTNDESISYKNTPKVSKIEMTPWDLQLLLLETIQKGLIFHRPKKEENNIHKSSFIDHLKKSLCHTLHFFPPLAGLFSIVKNSDDDTWNSSTPKLIVSMILDSTYVPSIIHSLFPLINTRNFEGVTKPLFSHHPIHFPMNLDDEKLFEKFEVPTLMERLFHLSKENIGRLKNKANNEMGVNSISSFQAYLAQLWQSVTRCRNLDAGKEVIITIPIGELHF
ncbi:hypothetical protein H5410_039672 [Solanum commersonii]|uniref:Uncharacterized protein n=1 Tax=Solanum commersonii TaxID=4109 RepID=A0A9J5XQA0_SOLCO|nr:hypothetical protein H5410_039672 [Solanum commersonii]